MIGLLDINESLTAVMSGAAATTNPNYQVHYRNLNGSKAEPTGALNGTTAVTLITVPGQEQRCELDRIQIYNGDTAAVTVTIAKVVGGTSYTMLKVTIPVGGLLRWTEEGVRVTDSSGQLLQSISDTSGTGTASNGAAAAETAGVIRKTVLSLTDVAVTVGNTTGVSFGGTKIYDFPAGRILILGATLDGLTFDLTDAGNVTPIATTHGGDIAFGTTAPTDGTLSGTDVDVIPSTSIDPISAGVTGAALAASAQFDGTTAAKDVFLNILIDDADVADGASDVILVSGVLTLHWVFLGDY